MKKKFTFLFLFITVLTNAFAQTTGKVETVFNQMWKANPGIATYRTNIIFDNGQIILGTYGATAGAVNDAKDGVYLINPKTGVVNLQIKTGNEKEDVNGVAADGDKIFFGTHNKIFYCFNKAGKKLWSYEYDRKLDGRTGQIEGCPALADLNGDGILDVVFNMEAVGTIALNGKNGKVLWDFIDQYCDMGCFMNSPAIYDLNNDGTGDVIVGVRGARSPRAGGYGDYMAALNGKNGDTLWTYGYGSGMKNSPHVLVKNNKASIIFAESYSYVHFLDVNGNLTQYIDFTMEDGGISGLFSSAVQTPSGTVAVGTSWWGENDVVWTADAKSENFDNDPENHKRLQSDKRKSITTGKVTATPVVADVLGNGKYQIIFCTEGGEMLITEENGNLLYRLKLPEGTETTPLVKDIDGDGFLEIVIGTMTGDLFCFKTKSKGKVHYGQFRGDNHNTGVIKF